MKSIVLCERELVQESKDFHSLKEEKLNENGDEKTEEKKILNGKSENKLSDTSFNTSEVDETTCQNGKKESSEEYQGKQVEEVRKSDSTEEKEIRKSETSEDKEIRTCDSPEEEITKSDSTGEEDIRKSDSPEEEIRKTDSPVQEKGIRESGSPEEAEEIRISASQEEEDIRKSDSLEEEEELREKDSPEEEIGKNDALEEEEVGKNDIIEEEGKKNDSIEIKIEKNDIIEMETEKDDVVEMETEKNDIIEMETEKNDVVELETEKNDIIEEERKKNDIIEMETEKNDIIEEERKKNDIIEMETEKNDVVELETEKNDIVEIKIEKNDIVHMETEKNDIVQMETETSDIIEEESRKNDIIGEERKKNDIIEMETEKSDIVEEETEKNDIIEMETEKNDIIEIKIEKNDIVQMETETSDIIEMEIEKNETPQEDEEKTISDSPVEQEEIRKSDTREEEKIEKNDTPEEEIIRTSASPVEIISKSDSTKESKNETNVTLTNNTDGLVQITNSDLCSETKANCSVVENISSENEISNLEDSPTYKSNLENEIDFTSDSFDDGVKTEESELLGNSLPNSRLDLVKDSYDTDEIKDNKMTDMESKKNVESLEHIMLDSDENKENLKDDKTDVLDFPDNDLLSKDCSECEIKVGDVQSISGPEKDSMWTENDFKKSEQAIKDTSEAIKNTSEDRNMDDCTGILLCNEEYMDTIEKEESHDVESETNIMSDVDENVDEEMTVETTESLNIEELNIKEKERETSDLDNLSKKKVKKIEKIEQETNRVETRSRKRIIHGSSDGEPFVKKKRHSLISSKINKVQSKKKNIEDSSRCENVTSLDNMSASSKGCDSTENETATTKRASISDKETRKLRSSVSNETAQAKKSIPEMMFSALEKFRGTLKTLTRNDLEELIIQKLCEVITERSNVGQLRQRAQALEQDQERWKAKAQSLTKQIREMEMVMKKYINEVQKQIKKADPQVVTPLKVTRSVGLQVSFHSGGSKGSKSNSNKTNSSNSAQTTSSRTSKGPPPKSPSQTNPVPQNSKSKSTSSQKSSLTVQKSPVTPQKRTVSKPDTGSNSSNRSLPQQSLLNNNQRGSNTVQKPSSKPVAGVSPQQSPQSHQQQPQQSHQQQSQQIHQQQPQQIHLQQPQQIHLQQPQQIHVQQPQQIHLQQPQQTHHQQPQQSHTQQSQQVQQNGSKVIDLTDDDDRQTGNTAKTGGSIRVVNNLTQAPSSQNNKFAYLLPTTSTSSAQPVAQNRQVLIATPTMPPPNRQIMCSMPPLLFKGGNVVQSGSPPQVNNQSSKAVAQKAVRHPAPLPHRPVNQCNRPNLKLLPPRPALKISKVQTGIVLSWNMSLSSEHAPIASYQLYAYQESNCPPSTSLWKKVGDVKALPLPMACTLTQFMSGHKYHFAVRAVDHHSRIGPFSFPGTIVLV